MFQSINILERGDQKISYKELNISLDKLFASSNLTYTNHEFIRPAPVDGICK